MGTETLSGYTNTGITLTATGADSAPFTVTAAGTIKTGGVYGVASKLAAPLLINEGSIIETASGFGFGVYLTQGGTLQNSSGAVIQGGIDAVLIEVAAGTVSNAGTISTTIHFGVQLAAGGTVTNTGTIAGAQGAVEIQGSGGDRVVAGNGAEFIGTVSAAGTGNTLEFSGTGGTVASIGTQFSGFQTIAFDPGAAWTISGSAAELGQLATISGVLRGDVIDLTGFAAASASYAAGTGLVLTSSASSVTLDVGGYGQFGIASDGHGGTDILGEVQILGSATTAGITLTSDGAYRAPFAVTPSGAINASGPASVYSKLAAPLLINAGSITDTLASNGIGVLLADGGTVINSGTIAGSLAVDIQGAGDARVAAGNGAVFIGAVAAAGTGNTLELSGTGGTVASIGSQFSGFQTIAFDPGAVWTISGDVAELTALDTITGVTLGDVIDLKNIFGADETAGYITGAGLALSFTRGYFLSPKPGGGYYEYLRHTPFYLPVGWQAGISLSSDGHGGTDIAFVSTHTLTDPDNATGITLTSNGLFLSPFTVASGGRIAASGYGIYSAVSAAYLRNQGGIASSTKESVRFENGGTVINSGTLDGAIAAVELSAGGIVTNTSAAALIQGGTYGVKGVAGVFNISNAGTITGSALDGIYLQDGGTVTNSGTIAGSIAAVDLAGAGDSRVVAQSGAAFIGTVEAAGAYNTLEFSGIGGTVASIGTQFTGFQTIAFDSGAVWTISGDAATLTAATITGFSFGDVIDMTNFAATSASYTAGVGLQLSNATTSYLLQISGSGAQDIMITGDGQGGTDIGHFTTQSLSTVDTGGIALSAGPFISPFTITQTGAVEAGFNDGVTSNLTAPFLLNKGTIKTDYNFNTLTYNGGVFFNHGGTVVNSGSASQIYASLFGVIINNAPGTVTNAGLIFASLDAVQLRDGGVFQNSVGGYIEGFGGGLIAKGAAVTITNAGQITGQEGIFLYDSGTITNAGASSYIFASYQAVTTAEASINNAGRIVSLIYAGINLGGGDIANSGTITSRESDAVYTQSYSDTVNDGQIDGGVDGVHFFRGGGTVTNAGTISGSSGNGIFVEDGGTIGNTAAGVITGGQDGVNVQGVYINTFFLHYTETSGTITNAGTITGTAGNGVYLGAGGAVYNNGTGAIISGGETGVDDTKASIIISNAGIIIGTAKYGLDLVDQSTISNSGTIAGGVAAVRIGGTGDARLVAEAGGVFIGDVEAAGTGNALELGSAASGGRLDMGGSFSGFDSITFDSAGWRLAGTSSELANGETISGFILGDDIDLEDFAATSASYISGTGLVLSNATASETIAFTGGNGVFGITGDGSGGTDIVPVGSTALIATLSTLDTSGVTLTTTGPYLSPFTVTATGTIESSGTGVSSALFQPSLANEGSIQASQYGVDFTDGGTVTNSGSIAGGMDAVFDDTGGFTLNELAGGVFDGAVVDAPGTGVLNLAGTSAGTLDMGGSFAGFDRIDFGAAIWTLAGTSSELADGEVISGVLPGDALVLQDFAATSASYISATGLVLSNATASETIGVTGGAHAFAITADGTGGTDIFAGTRTLSTASTSGITITAAGSDLSAFTVTPTGTISSSGTGVYSDLNGAYLLNQGNIGSSGAEGVHLRGFGTVANTGTISSGASNGVYLFYGSLVKNTAAAALISGAGDGVELRGASGNTGTLINAGTIRGTTEDGVYFEGGGGAVTNSGGGVIAGGVDGVENGDTWIRVYNSGTIAGAASFGVYLINQSTVVNSGTIAGGVAAIDIHGTGDARLVAEAGAVFLGQVEASGPGNTLELASVASAATLDLGGSFSGFTHIAFDSAAWTLAGTSGELANGDVISGVLLGDELVLQDFAATSASYISGTGLVLSNATASETIGFTGGNGVFVVSEDGNGGTDILASTHTLSTASTSGIALTANGPFLSAFTVTATGNIESGEYGIYSTLSAPSLLNQGDIFGTENGVNFTNGGSIANSGTAAVISGGQLGIYMTAGGTVTNMGSLATIYGNATGIFTGPRLNTGGLDVTNSGTIAGSDAIYLDDGGTVTNSGTIAGQFDAVLDQNNGLTLNVLAGGVFEGGVADVPGTGVLNLAGGAAGTLDMGGNFSGFNHIHFGAAAWTLEGTAIELAQGETISGFALGDEVLLDGFTASSETYVAGTGLVLNNGVAPLTLDFAGIYVGDPFHVTDTAHGTEVTEAALCFLHGTRILTPTGQVAVEDLAIGDAVVTRFGGIQRIKWIGRQSYAPEFIASNEAKWPVCIQAGALAEGVPVRDLYVSPGHSMLLGDVLVLASQLVNGVTVRQTWPERGANYVQLDLGTHDCVIAEGAWSETYADAPGMRAQFHNAAEYEALYPDEPPVEALRLCAARPERGPKLAAALAPVMERAAAETSPGVLEGWIDTALDWTITGWARDLAHPDLPVRLELLDGDSVIGTALACDFREDLRVAAKGSGHCAFSFTPPFRLRADALATLVIRRAADGAELPGTARFRQASEPVRQDLFDPGL